jgi:hypothetical protein
VIALVSISNQGREDTYPAHVWTVSDGEVTRVRILAVTVNMRGLTGKGDTQ